MTVVLILLMAGTQLGCGKDKKEEKKTMTEAEKMADKAKTAPGEMAAMVFGGAADVEFANMVWTAMKGYEKWPKATGMQPGNSPHGKFVNIYYNEVNVKGKPYRTIVKDNFDQEKKLAAVTIMVQREAGYDPDSGNWFWVKYNADGTVGKNDKDTALAGRVAKGMDTGCIACHKKADGNDYIFTDEGEM